jgi:hypothetical protein
MRFLTALFAAFLALSAIAVRAEPIGVIAELSGEVRLLRDRNYLEAAEGVEVEAADIVETETNAAVQVDMEDGSVFRLGPNTRLAFTDYRLDRDKGVISAGLDLLTGWLRFAVAKLRRADTGYHINAPVLTLGIRGTEGVIEAANEQGGLQMHEGVVEVSHAETGAAPERVSAGEFIERMHGRPFRRHAQPPPAFAQRMPPVVQRKLARRAQLLRARGVPPRVIRAVTRQDAQRFLRNHPHAREQLRQRFHRFDGAGDAQPGTRAPLRPGGQRPGQPHAADARTIERPKAHPAEKQTRRVLQPGRQPQPERLRDGAVDDTQPDPRTGRRFEPRPTGAQPDLRTGSQFTPGGAR